ncbi:MAG: pitrilysin family protein [Myxococcota bacterium]|nr:pitrilysin family protein [Myxococcota bacterium]
MKKKIRVLSKLAVAMVLLSGCCGHPPEVSTPPPPLAPEPQQDAMTRAAPAMSPTISIHDDRLDNGLKILILSDHSAPVVTVQVWYRVGSRNERPGIRGLAHFTEHMMFKGSANVGPEDHARIIDAVGGTENAFTSEDVTAYHNTVPSDRIELAMALEAERMTGATLDETHFYKEREVVKEEIRRALQNNPIGVLFKKFRAVAYEKHPYSWTPGGTLEDLDQISLEDQKAFYKTHYIPNNAVLVVVGDTTPEAVKSLAHKYFGSIPTGPSPEVASIAEPEQTAYRRHEIQHPTQLPIAIGGYKVPAAADPNSAVLEVAEVILGDGKSSRLHRKLVREKKLAVFAGGVNMKMKDPGLFLVFAGYMPNVSAEAVEHVLIEEVTRLAEEGPTPDELTKAKNQLKARYTFSLTSLSRVGFELGTAELVEGDYRQFLKGATAYDAITAEDVKQVARQYLNKDRLTMAVLKSPEAGKESEKAAASEISEAKVETTTWPTAKQFLDLGDAAAGPIDLPPIARKTLANGLELMVIERREQPVVYFDLTVAGGRLTDPKGKAGLATLLMEMFTHGTKTRTAETIAEEVERLGGDISGHAGQESFGIHSQFLARDLEKGLAIFADVALNPTFPADEMDKAKQPILADIQMTRDSPISMAIENMNYSIFGYNHPRGRPKSAATLSSVTVSDLKAQYERYFQPQQGLLTVVGDVNGQETLKIIEAAFGKWQGQGDAAPLPPDPSSKAVKTVRLVDKPDLTQSTIMMGHLGIERRDPDYIPLLLGNYVLGAGGFSSRLMKNIRSKGGKTYGVGSRFQSGRTRGPFFAYTFTRNRETGATMQMILDEIKKIRKAGITAAELQAAKNNLAGSYAIALQPPEGMADELVEAAFYGLGDHWVRDYRKAITAPTLEDVNAALKKHLQPRKLAFVVIGNAKEIQKQVRTFGPIKKVDYLAPVPDEERKTP